MVEIENKLQRWGNSYGIVIPVEVIRRRKMKEGERVGIIVVKKSNVLRKSFGSHKFSKPVSQLIKESDKELYNE